MKNLIFNIKKFMLISIISIIITILFSYHVATILFGNNSLEVLTSLRDKKEYLKIEILKLQENNARLQKEYFELKNLEPD